ncbi:MAG: A24 family peptidase [Pirellulaceae bacterium]|nr:A24 family peptidase [Pirellulaceae bacterium]
MIPWFWYVALVGVGLILGTLINKAIYDWAWFVECSPSPYSSKKRVAVDVAWRYVPVIGWWWTRSLVGQTLYPTSLENANADERHLIPVFTKYSFLRPLLVELICGVGVPWLAWYYSSGAWMGVNWNPELIPGGFETVWVWVAFHTIVIALLLIAALIDWDERTIPDQVTTTGIVLALIVGSAWPTARLPNVEFTGLAVSDISPIHAFSPHDFPLGPNPQTDHLPPGTLGWIHWDRVMPILDPQGSLGLLTVLFCWLFWAILIVPSLCTSRFGWRKAVWLAWASVVRPARRTKGLAKTTRRANPVTWVALAVMFLGWIVAVAVWNLGGIRWEAMYSLSLSMMLAGFGTWVIRLLGSWTMGREALGFGDVTLMFMLGAAFGWQFALIVFPLAAVLAIGYVVFRMLTSNDNSMALGPWLSAAAVLVLLFWSPTWHDFTRQSVFGMGPILFLVIGVCLLLLPVSLIMLVWGKRLLGLDNS